MGQSISRSPGRNEDKVLKTEEEEKWFKERYIIVNRLNDECLGNYVLMDEKKNGKRRICVKEIPVSYESELKSIQTLLLKNFKRGSQTQEDNIVFEKNPESISETIYYHKNLIGIYEAVRIKPKEESFGCDWSSSSSQKSRVLYGLEYYPNKLNTLQLGLLEDEVWNLLEQVSSALSFISKTRNAHHGNLHSASIFIDDLKVSKSFKIVDPFIAEDISLVDTIFNRINLGEKCSGCFLPSELMKQGNQNRLCIEDLIKADIFSLGAICIDSMGKSVKDFDLDSAFQYVLEDRKPGENSESFEVNKKKRKTLSLHGKRSLEIGNNIFLSGEINFSTVEKNISLLAQTGKYSTSLIELLKKMVDENPKIRPELSSLFDEFNEHSTIHTEHSLQDTPRNSHRQISKLTNTTRCAQFHSPNSSPSNISQILNGVPSTEIKKDNPNNQNFSGSSSVENKNQRSGEQQMFPFQIKCVNYSPEQFQSRNQTEQLYKTHSSITHINGSFSRGRSPFNYSDSKDSSVRKFSGHRYKQIKILESSPQNLQVISRLCSIQKERNSNNIQIEEFLSKAAQGGEIKKKTFDGQVRDPLIHLENLRNGRDLDEKKNKVIGDRANLKSAVFFLDQQNSELGNLQLVGQNHPELISNYLSNQDKISEHQGWKIKLSGHQMSEGGSQEVNINLPIKKQKGIVNKEKQRNHVNNLNKSPRDNFKIGLPISRESSFEKSKPNLKMSSGDSQQFGVFPSGETNMNPQIQKNIHEYNIIPLHNDENRNIYEQSSEFYNKKFDANSTIYHNSIRINKDQIKNPKNMPLDLFQLHDDNSGQLTEQILDSSLIQLDVKTFSSCSPCNVNSSRSNQIHLQLNTLASSQASRQQVKTPNSVNQNEIIFPSNYTFENFKYKQIALDTVKEIDHQSEISEKTLSPQKQNRNSKEVSSIYDPSQENSEKKSTLSSFSILKDKITGYGTLFYQDGRKAYEGGLCDGLYHGTGTLWNEYLVLESKQLVDFRNLDSISATSSWQKFEGEFERGVKKGFGSIFFINGDLFQGNFSEDQASGIGTFTPSMKTNPQQNKYATVIVGNWTKNILTQVLQEQTVVKLN